MKHFSILLTAAIFFLCTPVTEAQKIEIEKRISRSDFPAEALKRVEEDFPQARKIKFYRETSADTTTYEAKVRFARHWYSVEFFPDGTLIDVEKKIKFHAVPEDVRSRMEGHWEKNFRKFKVVRCQEQTSSAGIRYEVEIKAKGEQGTAFYEYLFDADGDFIKKSKIILRPSDMTLY